MTVTFLVLLYHDLNDSMCMGRVVKRVPWNNVSVNDAKKQYTFAFTY